MNWLGSAGLFVLGACVGSFLNVVADRLPAGESLLHPPSHCPACGRQLAKRELVPIVGWLALRGRCRTCTAPIPLRVPAVELTTALVFAAAGWLISPWPRLVVTMGFASLLIAIAAIDLEHQVVLNRLVYPALALALAAALLPWPPETLPALGGGAVAFGALFAIAVLLPRGMGMGDVKLAAFIGLAVGFPLAVPVLLLAFISGGLVGGFLLLTRRAKPGDAVPFGPFLALAGVAGLLFGDRFLIYWLGRPA